jgi:hypothetical protein
MDNISKHSNISDSAAISGILPQTLIGKGCSLGLKIYGEWARHDYRERCDSSRSSSAKPVHAGAPGLLFVSKASRFTLLVSKQSRFAFSVNEPSSIWLFHYKRNAARSASFATLRRAVVLRPA